MLIVFLPLTPSAVVSYVQSSNALHILHSGEAPIAELPRDSGELVAIIPWSVLSWHPVTLPPGNQNRINPVLMGLLEDHLLEEASNLHFALAPNSPVHKGGKTQVAVCAKTWLREALAPFESQGLTPQRLVPELCPAPSASEQQLHWMGSPEHPSIVWSNDTSVLSLPRQSHQWPSLGYEPEQPPTHCYAEPALLSLANALVHTCQIQTSAQRGLLACHNGWDLAQGEWEQSTRLRGWRQLQQTWQSFIYGDQWRATRWALVLILMIQIIGLNAWAWHINQQREAQLQILKRALNESFPAVKVIVEPLLQMRGELARLQQSKGIEKNDDLDVMLSTVGQYLSPGATPTAIRFENGQLHLEGLDGPTLQKLSQVNWAQYHYEWRQESQKAILSATVQP